MDKLKLHAIFVAIFLVVAHVAMIFGILDPQLMMAGASAPPVEMQHSSH
ncbi:hypothetical protein M2243_002019 [Heliophilum fasciatum]|nr:hypothetical protein [Heliophilum fasciatum]